MLWGKGNEGCESADLKMKTFKHLILLDYPGGPHVIITSPLNVEEGAEVSVRVTTCEEDWPLLAWKVEGTISHGMLQPQAGKGVETGSPQDSRKEHVPADILIFAQ